jgi:GntR family transcriptional regulator
MRIDAKSHVPVFRQIIEGLQSAIAAGIYRSGEVLPSVRVLAIELQVNPNTVQRAYEELERQGMIEARRGVGKFVARNGPRSALGQAEVAVREAFERGVDLAGDADLSKTRVRELFNDVLSQQSQASRAQR